jgi:hypothetical protein
MPPPIAPWATKIVLVMLAQTGNIHLPFSQWQFENRATTKMGWATKKLKVRPRKVFELYDRETGIDYFIVEHLFLSVGYP